MKTKSNSPKPGADVVHNNLFGGVGEVRVWSLLRGTAEPFTAVLSCELSPGGSVGRHVQQEFSELVIGIDGDGVAIVNGEPYRLGPLSSVHVPLTAMLEIVNHSHVEPLRYAIVKARGG